MFSQPLTILIIDDSPEYRFTLRRYLERQTEANYEVIEASSGQEGLQVLKTVHVDGVLLDFHLSDLDGIEFLQQLNTYIPEKNLPVIMLTGMGNEKIAVEAMKNGAQDYLLKDNITPESLLKSLYLAIERVKLSRELEKSEQQFRATFEQAAVGIYHLNLVGEFLKANQRFCQITGYLFEEIQEKTLKDIIYVDDLPYYQKSLNKLLNNQITTFTLEQRYLTSDNLLVWVNLTVSMVNHANGRPDYLMGIVEDIEERKKAENALKKANQQLKTIIKQLAKQNQERTLLSRVSQYLQSCNTMEEAYTILADLLQPLFEGCSLGIYQLYEDQNLAKLVSSWGNNLNSKEKFPAQECWSLRQGKAHYAEKSHSQLFCSHLDSTSNLSASLCFPMMAQGKIFGILYISTNDQEKLTAEQQNLAQTVSENIVLSLVNLQLQETLREQSIRDSLTGLFNRRYLHEFLDKEIIKAQRNPTNIGIILIDADHFKRINDNFSHSLGDVVLKELSSFLKHNIRGSDIACRYGGEEFILVLPEANLENTYQRAEMLREKIKQLHFQYQEYFLEGITISIGVACFPDHGLTGETVINNADTALYQAKDQGRDRTIIFDPSMIDKPSND
ncbi:diguanylate cyclase [Crocosphaera sp. XPORK-15E]|uniref:diguanylate cyclase n=1 Tax=Crocosphaera sp. XPORK-15E TaxID=3110247 RepID=UPI002B21BE36|nr:diguanylate cyclase [Crocosphaera sp. XPORK-15E]MEA5536382.1 diguanylate cyclase [Crocosphaera sp. XPORK-15E]